MKKRTNEELIPTKGGSLIGAGITTNALNDDDGSIFHSEILKLSDSTLMLPLGMNEKSVASSIVSNGSNKESLDDIIVINNNIDSNNDNTIIKSHSSKHSSKASDRNGSVIDKELMETSTIDGTLNNDGTVVDTVVDIFSVDVDETREQELQALAEADEVVSFKSLTTVDSFEQKKLAKKARLDKIKQQVDRKKAIMKKIFEANKSLNLKDKKNYKNVKEQDIKNSMREILEAMRAGVKGFMKLGPTEVVGIDEFGINLANVIATPALKITSAIFGDVSNIGIDDVDLQEVPTRIMNPVVKGYYLIRESPNDNYVIRESTKRNPTFDATVRHPAFFTGNLSINYSIYL